MRASTSHAGAARSDAEASSHKPQLAASALVVRARLARQHLHRRPRLEAARRGDVLLARASAATTTFQTYRAHAVRRTCRSRQDFMLGLPRRRARGARRRAVLPAAVHRHARHPGCALPGRERRACSRPSCATTSRRAGSRSASSAPDAPGAAARLRRRRQRGRQGRRHPLPDRARLGLYAGVDFAKGPEDTCLHPDGQRGAEPRRASPPGCASRSR